MRIAIHQTNMVHNSKHAGIVRVWEASKTVWPPCYTQTTSELFDSIIINTEVREWTQECSVTWRVCSVVGTEDVSGSGDEDCIGAGPETTEASSCWADGRVLPWRHCTWKRRLSTFVEVTDVQRVSGVLVYRFILLTITFRLWLVNVSTSVNSH